MNEDMDSRHVAECKAIRSMIDGIASLCAANPEKIIDLLKEYLWTDDEVQEIKGSNVELSSAAKKLPTEQGR